MKEVWKDIDGYEGVYQISNFGRIKSFKYSQERYLKPRKDEKGYLEVNLYKNGNGKNCRIYKLVANAFIPNPNNYPEINHKDTNRTNNRADNLEWCTHNYNIRYSLAKKINQYDLEGNYIKTWDCMRDAERETNIFVSNISKCCKGEYKQSGGYIWRYADADN